MVLVESKPSGREKAAEDALRQRAHLKFARKLAQEDRAAEVKTRQEAQQLAAKQRRLKLKLTKATAQADKSRDTLNAALKVVSTNVAQESQQRRAKEHAAVAQEVLEQQVVMAKAQSPVKTLKPKKASVDKHAVAARSVAHNALVNLKAKQNMNKGKVAVQKAAAPKQTTDKTSEASEKVIRKYIRKEQKRVEGVMAAVQTQASQVSSQAEKTMAATAKRMQESMKQFEKKLSSFIVMAHHPQVEVSKTQKKAPANMVPAPKATELFVVDQGMHMDMPPVPRKQPSLPSTPPMPAMPPPTHY